MELPIKHKRGTTIPTANDLVVGEIAINTTTGLCYTKTSAGNVVAIGLDVAANWGNIGGTLSSQTDLTTALDAKADVAGETFTGKVVTTQGVTSAPLNIGQGTANLPSTTVAGDVWMGDNINFRDRNGTAKVVANTNTSNTFTQPQAILPPAAATAPALRITNQATNSGVHSIIVEDMNPDTSAFIVDNNGRVGVGQHPSTWVSDGTYLIEAAGSMKASYFWSGGNLGSSYRAYLYQDEIAVKNASISQASIFRDIGLIGGGLFASGSAGYYLNSTASGSEIQTAIVDGKFWSNTAGAGWLQPYAASSALSNYALRTGDTFTGKVNTTATASTAPLNIAVSVANPTTTVAGDVWIGTNTFNFKDSTNSHRTAANLNTVNTFSTPQIIQSPTSAVLPALRISNAATAAGVHSLVVGDTANSPVPDTSAFVIDQNGNLGVGVDPATWVPIGRKMEVFGFIGCSSPGVGADTSDVATCSHVKSVVRGTIVTDSSSSYSIPGTTLPNTVIVKQDDGSSSAMTIIVETNSTQGIPIGTQFVIVQDGAYPFTVSGAGGVTIKSKGGLTTSNGQYSVCTLIKVDTDEWYLAGDLV